MMKYEKPDQSIDLSHFEISYNSFVGEISSFKVSIKSEAPKSYPREVMSKVWKKVKRNGYQASKYAYKISLQELIIETERKPEKVQIAVMHGRRRYVCESRILENSFSNKNKYMVVWPGFVADIINFDTTLFKNPKKEHFDKKEWAFIVEEITKKGKIRPLAAVKLNFVFFTNPGLKTALKLLLRSLQKEVENCTLTLILSSTLVKEGNAMDDTMQSQASGPAVRIPFDIPLLSRDNGKTTVDFGDGLDEKEISVKPSTPLVIEEALNVPETTATAATNDEHRRHSKTDESPLPILPHRFSFFGQSDSLEHDIDPYVSGQHHPIPPQHLPVEECTTSDNFASAPPTSKHDESILAWCQRVTAEYIGGAKASDPDPDESELNVTLTRKIVTELEESISKVKDFNEELQKIAERILEVENLGRHVQEKIQSAEKNSEDEQKYVIEHMKLLNEKDALVRKQDYFYVAAEMSEVEKKLGIVQQQVNEVTTMNDADKTEEEKQRIDDLVEEYKSLIDKKNELAEILIQKEAEEEEHDKFGRQTLERSQNFLRSSQEPLNTSQRFINWMKSKTI